MIRNYLLVPLVLMLALLLPAASAQGQIRLGFRIGPPNARIYGSIGTPGYYSPYHYGYSSYQPYYPSYSYYPPPVASYYGEPAYSYHAVPARPYYVEQASAVSGPATMRVILPNPQATVVVEGKVTSLTGTIRHFETPPLSGGVTYNYRIRASWTEGYREILQERIVPVTAGQTIEVDFTRQPSESVPLPRN